MLKQQMLARLHNRKTGVSVGPPASTMAATQAVPPAGPRGSLARGCFRWFFRLAFILLTWLHFLRALCRLCSGMVEVATAPSLASWAGHGVDVFLLRLISHLHVWEYQL